MRACDIIIPVWNEPKSTKECVEKLKEHTRYPSRLIIIDNGSCPPTKEYLKNLKGIFPDYLLIRNDTNLGFVKAVNQGFRASKNPYVCLLNNDAYVSEKWLTSLIGTVEMGPQNIGIANPTSNVFGKNSAETDKPEWQELDFCRGFCMLIKREVLQKVGFFDEIFGMGYFEEKDFARRALKAGYISIRAKSSFVYHRDKLSFDKIRERNAIFRRNEKIYNQRWGRPLRIAFVIEEKKDLTNQIDVIYRLLDKGHRINIFYRRNKVNPQLKDHIEIRYFPMTNLFFRYITLFKIVERYRKKRIELIVTGGNLLRFFITLKSIHGAEVVDGNKPSLYAACATFATLNKQKQKPTQLYKTGTT